jgi:hypothetical protein
MDEFQDKGTYFLEKIRLLKIKRRSFLRSISMLLLAAFVCQELGYANPELKAIPLKIDLSSDKQWAEEFLPRVPESVAVIESANKSHQVTRSPGHKIVVLLQDAHTNYSAQKNEAVFLDKLLAKHPDISHIYTEAAWGDVSLSELRERAPLTLRDQVSKKYLRQGLLHGVEYLDMTSRHHFKIWGVEDAAQYKRSVQTYASIAKKRGDLDAYISKFETGLYWLAPRVLNPLLQKFESKRQMFRKDEISLTEYFDTLWQQGSVHTISLAAYKNLNSLKRFQMLERGIDFAKANAEMTQAIAALNASDKKELFVQSRQVSVSQAGAHPDDVSAGFFACLHEKIQTGAYPQLDKYFAYRDQIRELDMKQVLAEMTHFEEKLLEKLQSSDDERSWVRARRYAETHHALFALTLTPADHQQYKTDTSQDTIEALTGFLNEKLLQYGGEPDGVVFLKSGYKDMVKACEDFYELTLERDEMFVSNMLRKMDIEAQDKAVLITGGYHTNNIRKLLDQKNISTISVTPQVLQETNIPRYEKILLNQDLAQIASGSGYAAKMNMTLYAKIPGAPLGLRQFMDEMHPTGARLAGSSRVVRTKEQFRADWIELKKSLDNAAAPLTANQLAVLTKIPLSKIYQSLSFVPENDKPLNQHDKYNSPENIKRQNTARERALIKASMDEGDDTWKAIQTTTGLPAKKIYEHVLREPSLKSHANSPIESKRVFTKEQVAEIKSRIAQFLDFGRFSSSEIAGFIGISVSATTDFIRNSSALAGHQNLLKQDRKKPDLSKEVKEAKKLMALLLTSGPEDDISLILEGLRGKSLGRTGHRGIILPIKPAFYKYWAVRPDGEVGWDIKIVSARKFKNFPYVRLSVSMSNDGRVERDHFIVDLEFSAQISGQARYAGEHIMVRKIDRIVPVLGGSGQTKVNLDAVDKMGIPQSQGHGDAQNPALIHDRKMFWDTVVSVLERKGSRKYSDLVADLSQGADLDGALMSIPEEERIEVRQALQEALRPYISGARLAKRTADEVASDRKAIQEAFDSGLRKAPDIAKRTGVSLANVYNDMRFLKLIESDDYQGRRLQRGSESEVKERVDKLEGFIRQGIRSVSMLSAASGIGYHLVRYYLRSNDRLKVLGVKPKKVNKRSDDEKEKEYQRIFEVVQNGEGNPKQISVLTGLTYDRVKVYLHPVSGRLKDHPVIVAERNKNSGVDATRRALSELIDKPADYDWTLSADVLAALSGRSLGPFDQGHTRLALKDNYVYDWPVAGVDKASEVIIREAGIEEGVAYIKLSFKEGATKGVSKDEMRRKFYLGLEQTQVYKKDAPGAPKRYVHRLTPATEAAQVKAKVAGVMRADRIGGFLRAVASLAKHIDGYIGSTDEQGRLNIQIGKGVIYQLHTGVLGKRRVYLSHAEAYRSYAEIKFELKRAGEEARMIHFYVSPYDRTNQGALSLSLFDRELGRFILGDIVRMRTLGTLLDRARVWVGREEIYLGEADHEGALYLTPWEFFTYRWAALGSVESGWKLFMYDRQVENDMFIFSVRYEHPSKNTPDRTFAIPLSRHRKQIKADAKRLTPRAMPVRSVLPIFDLDVLTSLERRRSASVSGHEFLPGEDRARRIAVDASPNAYQMTQAAQIWDVMEKLRLSHPSAHVRAAVEYYFEEQEVDGFIKDQPEKVQMEVRLAFAEALRPFVQGARLAQVAREQGFPNDIQQALRVLHTAAEIAPSQREGFSVSPVAEQLKETASKIKDLTPSGNLLGHFDNISYQDTPEFYKLIVVVSSLFQHYRKQFLSFNQVGRIETRMQMASEVVRKEMGLRGERANRLLELYLSHEFSIELEIEKGRGAELTDDQQKALISTLVKQKILSSKSRVDLDQMRQMTSGQAVRLMDELKSLEKIVSERFYKGEEQVRWFRFMSLEMAAAGIVDPQIRLHSAKTISAYRRMYQELVSRGYDPNKGEADYVFPGGDISTALLLTNAPVIHMHDVLPYDDPTVAEPADEMRMIYTTQKATAGYNSSDLLKAIGALKYPIRWELEALGATQITEMPLQQTGAYEINFVWAYDRTSAPTQRKIIFTQGDEDVAPQTGEHGDQVSIVKANLFRGNTFSPRSKYVITFEKAAPPAGYEAVPIDTIVSRELLKGRLHYDHPSGYADLAIGSLLIRKEKKSGARLAQSTPTDLKIIAAAQSLSEADPFKRISTKDIAVKAGVGVSTVSLRMTKNEAVKNAVNMAMSVDRRIIKAAELFVSSGEKKITAQKIADRIDVNINTITTRKNADPDVRKAVEDATSFDNQIFRALDRIRASHKGAVTKGLIADESGLDIHTISGRMQANEKIKEAIDEMMRLTEADHKILDAIERLKSHGVRAVTQEMIADEANVNEATVSDSKQRDEKMRAAIDSATSLNERDVKMLDAAEVMKKSGEIITPRRLATKAAVDHKTVRQRLRSDNEVGQAILTAKAEVQAQLNILKNKHDEFIDQIITRVIGELVDAGQAINTVRIAAKSGLSLRLIRIRIKQNQNLRQLMIDKNMSAIVRNIPIVSKSARQWDKAENDRKLQAVSRERTPDQAAIATEMWGILSRKLSGMGDKYEVIAQRLMGGDDLDGFLSEGVISEKEMLDLKQILREALSGYANTRPDGARLAATLTATRRTGAVMIGSTKFHVKMRDGKVVIYQRNGFGWSKAFIAASGSIRSISQSSQIQLEMSQSDLMALLKTFSMKVDALDAAQTELKNKNALAVFYVDRFVNEKTWDESLHVLSAQMAKVHRSDPKAGIVLAGVRAQKVYQDLIQINPSLADFIYAGDESVPAVFKNAPRTILEALDSSSVPTQSEGRRLFVQALPEGAVYNFYDLIRLALIEARMGELSTSNPVLVDFMRTWSDLLGEPIKSIDQFMRVLSGEERNIQVILQFAFMPKPLPIQMQARAYMMMSRQFAQAA